MPKENESVCPVCKGKFSKKIDFQFHIKEKHPHSVETRNDPDIKPHQKSEEVFLKFADWKGE